MNISAPFIKRPVATTLMAIGLFLVGAVAYIFLPVASLPSVEFPVIRVIASRPGADPETMAASVAAPLERHLGEIAGVNEVTSNSTLGSSSIAIQFDLDRNIDNAARDVQAALNAAATDLPGDLPTLPSFRKANPAAAPVIILALTSDTLPASTVYDAADTVIAQRISQVDGVGEVTVNGAEQPAIRVRVDPARLAAMGISLEAIRTAIVNANAPNQLGSFENGTQSETIGTNDRITALQDYRDIVVTAANGTVVKLSQIAQIDRGVRNSRAAGWYNRKPAVLLLVTKQADANVIDTVDRVKALIPQLKRLIPAGVNVEVMADRTLTIRASIHDIQRTLMIAIALVMMVVFVFLRRATPTVAAGITVPLSLAGTCAAMWLAGFTLDNLSLMAITISVGFVVDDAIVMIENIHRNMEAGMGRLEAALTGARQIGFTVVSISVSLIAAFIPLLFMQGILGRLFREFSLTLVFAIVVSTFVSLTITPMICGRFMRRGDETKPRWYDRVIEGALSRLTQAYARSLQVGLRHPWLMLIMTLAIVALTVELFRTTPKGYFPQDDTGLLFGFTEASPDISFPAMAELQQKAGDIVVGDPAVAGVSAFVGGQSTVNHGTFYVSLKPEAERKLSALQVIARMREKLDTLPGLRVYFFPVQDLRSGARQGKAQYQFTLWDPNFAELVEWFPRVLERIRKVPGLVDVASDREKGGLEANVVIDRSAASRLGVAIQDIDNALGDAYSQRQISTIFSQRNQYRVVLEVIPSRSRDPSDFADLYVPGRNHAAVPLAAVAHVERTSAPLVVNHQGQFPSITITYNLPPNTPVGAATEAVQKAVDEMHLPAGLHAEFAGDAKAIADNSSGQGVLILVALLAVYIVLGVLYESLVHPVTIISTLPSAGLGALIAINVAGLDLTVIAFIGIILLIGIVKKNGIMLVDFAIHAERVRGLRPSESILEACIERFRPILMTTLAALFGAIPLAIAMGAGAELRRPLGITIVGGLILSQALTLYTTPVIYLQMARLARFWRRRRTHEPQPAPALP
ncbi:MAG: efflux RND transporter permease subunit [Hyphomicrobiales bacterium]|nr:efflux RND transporter permease subunit [Hyphomicrobiales bacterium]MBV9518186.1 efflux RND transporter permease subunit [Hyphomicrobiales bacterium]